MSDTQQQAMLQATLDAIVNQRNNYANEAARLMAHVVMLQKEMDDLKSDKATSTEELK